MQGPKISQIPAARLRIIERIAAQAVRAQRRVGKIATPALVGAY